MLRLGSRPEPQAAEGPEQNECLVLRRGDRMGEGQHLLDSQHGTFGTPLQAGTAQRARRRGQQLILHSSGADGPQQTDSTWPRWAGQDLSGHSSPV